MDLFVIRHGIAVPKGELAIDLELPAFVRVLRIAHPEASPYAERLLLVRPDAYIATSSSSADTQPIATYLETLRGRTEDLRATA